MIKMRYSELSKVAFLQAVQKLANSPLKTPKAFKIKHIIDAIQRERDTVAGKYQKQILDAYEKKGGEVKDLGFACIPGKEEEAKKALEEFGSQTFEIKQTKIDGNLLFEVNSWTVAELTAMEPIVSELYVE